MLCPLPAVWALCRYAADRFGGDTTHYRHGAGRCARYQGDFVLFFGESFPLAFVYVPYYLAPEGTPFWAPANPMNTTREASGIATLPSGHVLVAGGLTAKGINCISTPATPIQFSTNTSRSDL